MTLLEAVNTVLPHLGEHVITRIEGARHPTVDLIIAAIDRQRISLLKDGWWFNEMKLIIPVNTDGRMDTPIQALAVYGNNATVVIEGETLFNLTTGSRIFTEPLDCLVVRDVVFEHLPPAAALTVVYRAGAEVYLQDYGRENTVPELQALGDKNHMDLKMENTRNRRYNSIQNTRKAYRIPSIRFR